ncbi:MAG: ABC-2 family transporter protein [Chloroflexi bacterium]|nr:ABC-2 family transporter protein [Chloroflexota bacterium]
MLKRYTSLYWYFLLQRFKILMEYRVNFFIGAFSTVLMQSAGVLAVWVIMRQIPDINGWTLNEILLIYGLLTLAKSINHMFADNLWVIGWGYIRPGGFDRFLVRPINPLFHLLADRFCHDGLGNLLVGTVLVGISSHALGIVWTPLNLLYLIMVVISGGVIFIALNLITATSAFFIIESIPITQVIFNTHEFARFPLTIYPRAIGLIMTWLIPYGFASFYPASQLLGRDVGALAWLSPFVAVILAVISYRVWLFGLRHSSGTGS